MFDKDFFPTPKPVIQRMLQGVNLSDKRVLDPSAGKGDILDYILELLHPDAEEDPEYPDWLREDKQKKVLSERKRAQRILFAVERHPELQSILRGKGYALLDQDFLRFAPEIRFDLIAMNPPFSAGAAHLLRAIEISDGAEIRCLLPLNLLQNPYTQEQQKLVGLLGELNARVEDLGPCFEDAERTTSVQVGLICIPSRPREKTFEFQGSAYGETQFTLQDIANNQLERTDVIGSLVHRYTKVKELGYALYQTLAQLNFYASGLGVEPLRAFKNSFGEQSISYQDTPRLEAAFGRYIQTIRADAWANLYEQTKISGLVTSAVRKDIEESSRQQGMMAFTLENIEGLFEALVMNLGNIRSACILQAFEILTKYHDDNKVHVEGWKTNDAWMINEKIIIPYGVSYYNRKDAHPSLATERYHEFQDIEKALCFVTGKEFEKIKKNTIAAVCDRVQGRFSFNPEQINWGEWNESEFFLFKFFKKGTLHLKFKDPQVCLKFNLEAAAGKNWLPADWGKSTTQRKKAAA